MNQTPVSLDQIHEEACSKGRFFYSDPATGCRVFTKLFHLKRGDCCGNICRHCPYEHKNVPENARAK